MEKIIIYGTGYKATILVNFLLQIHIQPYACVDGDSAKCGKSFYGIKIYSPQFLVENTDAVLVIGALDPNREMYQNAIKLGMPVEKIKTFWEAIMWILDRGCKLSGNTKNKVDNTYFFDVINGYNAGGVEEWSKSIVTQLMDTHPVYLLGPLGDKPNEEYLCNNIANVSIDRANLWTLANVQEIISLLENSMPCTVITASPNISFMAASYLTMKYPEQIQIIAVVHQGTRMTYKEYAAIDKYCKKMIGVSEDIVEGLIDCGIKSDKVFHMTCPVQIDRHLLRSYTAENDAIHIGYAGRIVVEQKRLDRLPEILEKLEQSGINYILEIAGDGPYLEELKILTQKYKEKIKFVGKIDRKAIPEFWKRQDVGINLSDHEGRSISVMEMMANGVVPIVTRTSGIKEDIADSENGFVVEISDYLSIADKIFYLSKNRNLIPKMGKKAFSVISKKCDMEIHVAFWRKLLDGLQ